MSEEKTKKTGRSVALSGFVGFVLVAFFVGLLVGGYVSLFVIAPQMQNNQQSNNNQATSGSQNNNNQNSNNNNNNQGYTGDQSSNGNNQNGYNNQGTTNYQNSTSQNDNNTNPGVTNNNPAPTNPTGQYSASGCQFALSIPTDTGGQASGTITANLNCVVQQNGGDIQLALTLTPTMIPQGLSQNMDNSPATFNFAGTVSGAQINAQATGSTGPDNSGTFEFHLTGSFGSNTLTLNINSASGSQISLSTPQSITLQSTA